MEIVLLLKVCIVLLIVIFLIIATLKIIKNFYKFGNYVINPAKKELRIKEVLYIDPTIKLVNIVRGKRNYILMLGKNSERLIEAYDEE
jgi:hypothetical protein